MYLNKVYFGDGLYGVEAASLGYFGKPASAVTVAEAALLAGLVKSPSSYAPTVSLEKATARRNIALRAMFDAEMIDKPAYQQALKEPVKVDDALRRGEAFGQYFKEEVRRFLVERRTLVELGRRRDLLQPAGRHHADPIAEGQCLLLVVGHEQGRRADLIWIRRISSRSCRRTFASSAESGSSSSRTLGSIASARANATRCCWPPESWYG